jgi:hypothetical protein
MLVHQSATLTIDTALLDARQIFIRAHQESAETRGSFLFAELSGKMRLVEGRFSEDLNAG